MTLLTFQLPVVLFWGRCGSVRINDRIPFTNYGILRWQLEAYTARRRM